MTAEHWALIRQIRWSAPTPQLSRSTLSAFFFHPNLNTGHIYRMNYEKKFYSEPQHLEASTPGPHTLSSSPRSFINYRRKYSDIKCHTTDTLPLFFFAFIFWRILKFSSPVPPPARYPCSFFVYWAGFDLINVSFELVFLCANLIILYEKWLYSIPVLPLATFKITVVIVSFYMYRTQTCSGCCCFTLLALWDVLEADKLIRNWITVRKWII